jgi:hypothetical protein
LLLVLLVLLVLVLLLGLLGLVLLLGLLLGLVLLLGLLLLLLLLLILLLVGLLLVLLLLGMLLLVLLVGLLVGLLLGLLLVGLLLVGLLVGLLMGLLLLGLLVGRLLLGLLLLGGAARCCSAGRQLCRAGCRRRYVVSRGLVGRECRCGSCRAQVARLLLLGRLLRRLLLHRGLLLLLLLWLLWLGRGRAHPRRQPQPQVQPREPSRSCARAWAWRPVRCHCCDHGRPAIGLRCGRSRGRSRSHSRGRRGALLLAGLHRGHVLVVRVQDLNHLGRRRPGALGGGCHGGRRAPQLLRLVLLVLVRLVAGAIQVQAAKAGGRAA